MSQGPSEVRDLADRLIAHEARNSASQTRAPAGVFVGDRLRLHLAALMGNLGYRALLSRALALTNAKVAWLRAVHVTADGSLERSNEESQVGPEEIAEGNAILLAQLLGLLVAFIGENLTLRLVHEAWPDLSVNDLVLATGAKK